MTENGRDGALPCWRIAQRRGRAVEGRHSFASTHRRKATETHTSLYSKGPRK